MEYKRNQVIRDTQEAKKAEDQQQETLAQFRLF